MRKFKSLIYISRYSNKPFTFIGPFSDFQNQKVDKDLVSMECSSLVKIINKIFLNGNFLNMDRYIDLKTTDFKGSMVLFRGSLDLTDYPFKGVDKFGFTQTLFLSLRSGHQTRIKYKNTPL